MLSEEQILERNKLIAENSRHTREKRKTQICKTFRFKIDWGRLNKRQKECLKMMFVEAKWIYNYIISQEDIKSIDYKTLSTIIRKDKDKNDISTQIKYLGSSVKQELIAQVLNQIKGLSVLKKKGHKVGKLKYKSEINSIKLKQYKVTHYLKGNNKIKVQGIHDPLPLLGMNQLCKYKDNIDYTTANLVYDGINYYVCLTCFIDKDNVIRKRKNSIIGIDLGIKDTVTCSDGTKFNISIGESEKLKKLQRKLDGQIKGSNNRYKTIKKIRKEYIHITNKKNDIANKLVHDLLSIADIIVMQDEQIESWRQTTNSADKIQHSILGRIKARLSYSDRVVILDKYFPTTKYCSNCGNMLSLELNDRIYECPVCKRKEDRDIHAANNMIYFYQQIKDRPGTDQTLKLVSYNSYKEFVAKQESTMSLA